MSDRYRNSRQSGRDDRSRSGRDDGSAWGIDLPRRTMAELSAFNRAAIRTSLSALELQLTTRQMGADLSKAPLESYLRTVEAFAPDSTRTADASEGPPPGDRRPTPEPTSRRGPQVTAEPPPQGRPESRAAGDRGPGAERPDERTAAGTLQTAPPRAPDRSPDHDDRSRSPARAGGGGTHERRPESPRSAPTVESPVGGDPRLEPERTAGPRSDESARRRGPDHHDAGGRPGGETPLRGPDARDDPDRDQPPTKPGAIPEGADRRVPGGTQRQGPESTDRRLEDERDARDQWSDDRPGGSAGGDESERRVDDGTDRGLDDAGQHPGDSGRHVDEPKSDLSESDTDDLGTDAERSTGDAATGDERLEEVPIELDRGDVSEDRATEDRTAEGSTGDEPVRDERTGDERSEGERAREDRTTDDRSDEDERPVDEETPDESGGLLRRFLRR